MEWERHMNIIIPNIYKSFLSEKKQLIFDDGVLYDYEEIAERYETLEFAEFAEEYIPIGNDNGDYELVMRAGEEETLFAIIDQGALGSVEPEGWTDFSEWYSKGPQFDFFPMEDTTDSDVSIFIKALPEENSVKVLLKIKKVFKLDMSTPELLKLAKNLPAEIIDQYYGPLAKEKINENNLQEWVSYK